MALHDLGIPFTSDKQLCHQLTLQQANGQLSLQATSKDADWLPGNPGLRLDSPRLTSYVHDELATPRLNKMHPYLWLVATPSSSHITAIHAQFTRGRNVVITENPELHLVWIENKVFLKPIPPYLLSYDFWRMHLAKQHPVQEDKLRQATLGYMRSYYYLIRHESDWRIAQRENLIPADASFPAFIHFISHFAAIADHDVSLRYQFGQLRLTRLNLWAKLALGQWEFHKVAWQYGEVFARHYAPVLFAFGLMSVILSAMQVGSQARPDWTGFLKVSAWFSVVSLLFTAVVLGLFMGGVVVMLLNELLFVIKVKLRNK